MTMAKRKSFKNNRWYFAYAGHRWSTTEDIINKPFRTYSQAVKEASHWMNDDTVFAIYYRHENQWFEVTRA